MDKSLIIGIGILVAVCFGILIVSNMSENVITGFAVKGSSEVIENEYYKISEFGNELNESVEVKNGERGSR